MQIGFIGLGIMGKPMARNLMRVGHTLRVYDIVPSTVAALAQDGAQAATSPAAAAKGCEIIITMLPNSPHVREVALGDQGLLAGAAPGTIWADMSSIAPATAIEMAAESAKRGVHMLDCPVSGGEPKAIDATLSIMCGGNQADFDRIVDVLKCMGSSVVLVGDVGSGNTTKLGNQIIVAVNIAAVSEAFALAVKAGVDPHRFFDAIKGGLAGSTVMNFKAPMTQAA